MCVCERKKAHVCTRKNESVRESERTRAREQTKESMRTHECVYAKTERKCKRTRVGMFEGMYPGVKREKARDTEKKLCMI